MATATKSKERKKKGRPDGTDESCYKGWEKWSYRKWAWEFLRRNPDFISACKKVRRKEYVNNQQDVATDFGLKKFKPYTESYSGISGKPAFSVGSIASWTNINSDTHEVEPTKPLRLVLLGGQAIVRFDVATALADKQILEKQLRVTRIRLENRLKMYSEKLGIVVTNKHPHKVGLFVEYLRLLDGIAAGRTQFESALSAIPGLSEKIKKFQTTKEEQAPAISKKIRRANKYTTELYRYLAVLKGRPTIVQSV
jgi:hypothetical protein